MFRKIKAFKFVQQNKKESPGKASRRKEAQRKKKNPSSTFILKITGKRKKMSSKYYKSRTYFSRQKYSSFRHVSMTYKNNSIIWNSIVYSRKIPWANTIFIGCRKSNNCIPNSMKTKIFIDNLQFPMTLMVLLVKLNSKSFSITWMNSLKMFWRIRKSIWP